MRVVAPLFAVGLFVSACGSSGLKRDHEEVVDVHLSEQGVRFATLHDDAIHFWRATPAAVTADGVVALPGPGIDVAWLDSETALVLLPDQQVGRIVAGRYEALPPIPATAWTTPRPPLNDEVEADEVRDPEDPGELRAMRGEIWVHRCMWEYGYEQTTCEAHRWVRVYPTYQVQSEPPALEGVGELPTVAGPAGFVLANVPIAREGEDETSDPITSVACTPPGGPASVLPVMEMNAAPDGFDQMFSVHDAHWIRASPPRFVATADVPCLDMCEEQVVVSGCPATSALVIGDHRLGPAGTWAWRGYDQRWRIEGAADVAPIEARDLAFAPQR